MKASMGSFRSAKDEKVNNVNNNADKLGKRNQADSGVNVIKQENKSNLYIITKQTVLTMTYKNIRLHRTDMCI